MKQKTKKYHDKRKRTTSKSSSPSQHCQVVYYVLRRVKEPQLAGERGGMHAIEGYIISRVIAPFACWSC